jgi:2,5-diamino-6-(ribosylamino)-4(3H)-pyrimidinone 5'-phosphate reductase
MLPVVVIHNAVSVDGRTDWFTANIEKFYDITNVWKEDATLAGSDTLLAAYGEVSEADESNDFEATPVEPGDTRPLLVVPDSRGRLRIWHLLKKEEYWRDIIVLCSKTTPEDYLVYLDRRHVKYIVCGEDQVDFKMGLDEINTRYGVNTVRVDSGGTLNGILLRAGLVHEVSILIHPCLVGGTSPRSMYKAADLGTAEDVIELKFLDIKKPEGDLLWIRYQVIQKEAVETEEVRG